MIENESWFLFIIYSLATWRLSTLLVVEDGPYAIFIKLRMFIGTDYGITDRKATIQEIIELPIELLEINYRTEIAKALSCVWCTSMWVSLLVVVLHITLPINQLEVFQTICVWLSISALAIKFNEV